MAAEPRPPRPTQVWADTATRDICKHRGCRRDIVFAQNVKTGKVMPFNAPLVALAETRELGTNRVMWTVDLNTSHFISCVASESFRRKK